MELSSYLFHRRQFDTLIDFTIILYVLVSRLLLTLWLFLAIPP